MGHFAARCKCCITFCVIRSDMSPCQMSSKKHHCVWSMLLAGSCKTSWANVPGPSSFVQRASASSLQFCGCRIHSQDLPCCGANCGLAPPHLQVDERSRSQCLGLHSAFRHGERYLQLSAPCSHEAALMSFSSHVLPDMFLFHGHAWPCTSVHVSIAHAISGFAARRARLGAFGAPGEKMIFQAARAEYKCLVCAWSPGPGFRLQVCSGCFQAFYCDGVCQAQHWHMHKALCR